MPPVKKEPSLWDNLKNSVKPATGKGLHSPSEEKLSRAFGFGKKPETNYLQFQNKEQYKQYKKNKGY